MLTPSRLAVLGLLIGCTPDGELPGEELCLVGCDEQPAATDTGEPAAAPDSGETGGEPDSGEPGETASPETGEPASGGGGEPVAFSGTASVPAFSGFVLPVDDYERLADTFGLRALSLEDDRVDFHMGVDFVGETGDPVYAAGDGTIYRVHPEDSSDGSSNYVIVRHLLDEPILFHDAAITKVYTVYSHLSAFEVELNEEVSAGDLIGRVGTSGGAETPHLHLELRLGTHCTLEYQTENPDSSCVTGYDPSVHPFHAVGLTASGGLELTVLSEDPYMVAVTSDRDDLDLVRVESDLGTIDFDTREGMDATTEEGLDRTDYGWVVLEPSALLPDDAQQVMVLRFDEAPGWLEVTDVYGGGERIERATRR